MIFGMMAAYAPSLLIHLAWLVIALIGMRRHGGTPFVLFAISAVTGLIGTGVGAAQFVVISRYGVSTIQIFAIVSGLIGVTTGVLSTVGLALLVARAPTRATR
jgi:hypothetical protein